jgi:5'-3' exonuclease
VKMLGGYKLNRLILIDGSSLLSTSFYGNLPKAYYFAKTEEEREKVLKSVMQTSNGLYTNGVFTMSRIILNIIKEYKPSHMAVAWDISRNTFRKNLYVEYKGHREETRPELGSQFTLMQRVLEDMNIPQYKHCDFEADDIIGTFSRKFEEQLPITILTKDQDALQLVSENTRLWLMTSKNKEMYESIGLDKLNFTIKDLPIPDNVFEFTPMYIKEFYGLDPVQIVDMKALCGDPSDNIPGVKGVGEKAVVPLLQEFGSVENLYDSIEDMSKEEEKEFKELLKELGISRSPVSYLLKESETELVGKKAALLSKKLATIECTIPDLLNTELFSLELNVDKEATRKIFEELEFKSLLDKIW